VLISTVAALYCVEHKEAKVRSIDV